MYTERLVSLQCITQCLSSSACSDHTAICVNAPAVLPRHFTLHCRHSDAFQMPQMMSHSRCHCCLLQNKSDSPICLCAPFCLLVAFSNVMSLVLISKVCLCKWRAKQTLQGLRGLVKMHRSNLSSIFSVGGVFLYFEAELPANLVRSLWSKGNVEPAELGQ